MGADQVRMTIWSKTVERQHTRVALALRHLAVGTLLLLQGPAIAQNPCEGRGACDALLINKGRAWDYQVGLYAAPRTLSPQAPQGQEQAVVEAMKRLFTASSMRAVVLLNGDNVIHSALKDGIPEDALFYGLSVGKTVTAIAAGQAICQKLISLDARVGEVLPEFATTDMGKASLKNLLTMASGTWEGLRDANVATPEQFREIWSGRLFIKDLMLMPRVHTAEKDSLGNPRAPGQVFSYRNSDPEMVALMVSQATGMPFTNWVEQSVLRTIPIQGPAVLRTDRNKDAFASGALQMHLHDWARLAAWVSTTYDDGSCLGNFLKEAAAPQLPARGPNGPFNQFGSYGYFTWVDHKMVPDSFYAHGVGGQIVAWNRKNKRTMVVFSNESPANDLAAIYRDWSKLP
jgi:CubicO group peptidase (beta-lactamase class C family)